MQEKLVEKMMAEVMEKLGGEQKKDEPVVSTECRLTEFVESYNFR